MFTVDAKTAAEIWDAAWSEITTRGNHRTHVRGNYREALHSVLSLEDPRQRWVTTRVPPINPAFALAEVIWILRGRNDSAFLTAWNGKLPFYAGEGAEFYGAYGERLRSRFGFDQLSSAAEVLRSRPDQRQVVLQIWDASSDFPTGSGDSRSPDIPCNVSSLLKVVDGRLEWLQVMRSNDLVRGLPYNLVQWTTIQEVLAGWLGLEVGSYVHISDSLHIYDVDSSQFSASTSGELPLSSADLRLDERESERVFATLENAANSLAESDSPEAVLARAEPDVPSAYADWIKVLAGERLRRLGQAAEGLELAETVEDRALRAVSRAWHLKAQERA
ncbi:thymidylate synthase [Diaminobutyricibacter sp. McL0608]|uniref:thymidylate synthase n=1 Tax=Leifsonia sp. McL0608 TaxID=3143537 RepID=UPI0031F32D59